MTKLSVLTLVYRLNQSQLLKHLAIGLIVFVAIWSVATTLAFAFQCSLPSPWNVLKNNCYNRVRSELDLSIYVLSIDNSQESFWIYFAVTNTLSELGIILLAVAMTWKLQVSKRKKFVVFSSFALRLM